MLCSLFSLANSFLDMIERIGVGCWGADLIIQVAAITKFGRDLFDFYLSIEGIFTVMLFVNCLGLIFYRPLKFKHTSLAC